MKKLMTALAASTLLFAVACSGSDDDNTEEKAPARVSVPATDNDTSGSAETGSTDTGSTDSGAVTGAGTMSNDNTTPNGMAGSDTTSGDNTAQQPETTGQPASN